MKIKWCCRAHHIHHIITSFSFVIVRPLLTPGKYSISHCPLCSPCWSICSLLWVASEAGSFIHTAWGWSTPPLLYLSSLVLINHCMIHYESNYDSSGLLFPPSQTSIIFYSNLRCPPTSSHSKSAEQPQPDLIFWQKPCHNFNICKICYLHL